MTDQTAGLPRELVLASAGTGKTYRISTRIIALLHLGVRPEEIFASTFTRKAAGEILDRVLELLAEAAERPTKAAELARNTTLPGLPAPPGEPQHWLALLERLVRDLHRMNVGTLDAFFVGAATAFGDELGLPTGWRIGETPVMERVRADALHAVLSSADRGAVLELVRALSQADAARPVQSALMARALDLLEVQRSLDPDAPDPWAGLEPSLGAGPGDADAAIALVANGLEAAEVPLTAKGQPDKRWVSALAKAAESLRSGDWDAFVASTLCVNCRAPEPAFGGRPVPPAVVALISEACELARWVIGRRLVERGRAMGRLAALLDDAVTARQRETGVYDFGDVTRLLGGPDPLARRPDLYYRLDARTQHILLDEFQDTSYLQWEALSPLLDELLSGYEGERAAVVVADPKQSIYAWRGGEPLLVEQVWERHALELEGMHRSWRSSQVVLDSVNAIFRALPDNPVFGEDQHAREVAAEWSSAFAPQVAVKVELPGHVRLVAGPADDGSGSDRPLLCRRAAEIVAGLAETARGRSIGVLTRRNRTVARIMMELGRLGIAASEEGGNPLTDSKAVASTLALLRMADHPGDTVARYHVARTPLGAEFDFTDHRDDRASNRLAMEIRRRLANDGYGRTLEAIAQRVHADCSARDRRRMEQLAELGFRYDDRATLRTTDFLRLVAAERVEDPTAADVRVMTVHQAKGLEFDLVVLPELDFPLEKEKGGLPIAYRPGGTGRVTRAFPYVPARTRQLFADVEELTEALRHARAGRLRDGLSGLYVALTRARHALHMIVQPDGEGGMKPSCTAAALVRHALAAAEPAAEGDVLFETGDPSWPRSDGGDELGDAPAAPTVPERVPLRSGAPRTRGFARRAPSELSGDSRVDVRMVLNLVSPAASEGTLAHAWFERVGWIEEGLPGEAELREIARDVEPTLSADRVESLIARWNGWLAEPAIRGALQREAYGPGTSYEREVRFIHRDGDAVLEGAIDRLVLWREDGRVTGAVILDYKTDDIAPGDAEALSEKVARYRPQLEAYRGAVASWYGISPADVACRLIVLEAGAVVEV